MAEPTHYISDETLTFEAIGHLINSDDHKIALSEGSVERIKRCRSYLETKIETSSNPVYGVNTGFGDLCTVGIEPDQLGQLQLNLIRSHACGIGERAPGRIVRLMILLKVHALAKGYSGIRLETVERLVDFYNHKVSPVVYTQGSLGASGDLAPLANLSLALIGEGVVNHDGVEKSAKELHNELGWEPLIPGAKEGLALLNGTQFMQAYAVHCLLESEKYLDWADTIGAMSLEGFDGRIDPFLEALHVIRPHSGQQQVATNIRHLLEGSELIRAEKVHVQDPYAFRCMPQVHGASRDTVAHVKSVVLTEINSVTDNPNVFPDEDQIISGGNFHGQPLALVLDFLAIAMAEIGSISERRVYQLISGSRGLPAFLCASPGLNSGLMIPQYTAASIVSQNKQFCTPASIDSIPSSNGQEDHVSMGANAATKCYKVIENIRTLLSIELLNASQALHFREPMTTSNKLAEIVSDFRVVVPVVQEDRWLGADMAKAASFLNDRHPNL